jgi:glucose uptake protein GlcU
MENLKNLSVSESNIKMIGEAILLASIQFSIGSVEMSSKFSVKNFSKDQETLQNAADALSDYLKIGIFWTIGVTIMLYSNYGVGGAISAILANLLIIVWIYVSYIQSFKMAANKYNLNMPKITII